jgi:hypothetical protein
MRLNRTDSDGSIIEFRKGTGVVGSIGTYAGDLTIGDDDVGIRFDTGTGLVPWDLGANTTGGAATNGAIDIGAASARFKDLHLSGTAAMGGLTVNGVGSVIALSDNAVFNVNVSGGTSKTSTINQRAKSSNGSNAETSIVVTGSSGEAVSAWDFKLDTANGALTKAMTIDGSGDISFYEDTGTTAKFFWDASAESLGINNSSPNAPLEVSGAATTSTDIAHFSNSNGVQKVVIGIDGQGDGQITLIDAGNNTDVLFTAGGVSYINTGGNFGLGTSTPQASIHTTGDAIIGTTTSGASYEGVLQIADGAVNERTVVLIYNNHPDQFMKLGQDVNTAFIGRDQADEFAIGVFDNAADTTLAKQFVIDASGNVLIGKSSAAISEAGTALLSTGTHNVTADGDTTLQLNRLSSDGAIATFFKGGTTVGSIGTEVADGTTPADLVITAGTVNASRLWLKGGDSGLILDGHTNSVLPTDENSYEDDRTDLGNSNYRFKDLHLSGVAYSDSVLVGATTFASAGGGHLLAPSGTRSSSRTVTTAAFHNLFYNANGIVGGISTSGSATTFATSSDQRLKDNIVDAPSASDDIDAIQVRSFDWKVDGSHQKYGMVAQELQSVAPESVSEGETEDDMMGVDYSKLVPMLVKEIQSLRARVAQLETN